MPEIEISTPDGAIGAILERPSGDGPHPAVVVLHDIAGKTEDLRRIAKNIAQNGYVALAPDLYARGGRARCVTRVVSNLLSRHGRAVDDILSARDYLRALPYTTESVGVIGFCLGGGFALVAAPRGFAASAPFYGIVPRNAKQYLKNSCPVVGNYGEKDLELRGHDDRLRAALSANDIDHDITTHPNVGHSFANQLPAQPLLRVLGFGYSAEAESAAWEKVYSFFDVHLSQESPIPRSSST